MVLASISEPSTQWRTYANIVRIFRVKEHARQTELNTIKTAINGNHTDLAEFKRQGAVRSLRCSVRAQFIEALLQVIMV